MAMTATILTSALRPSQPVQACKDRLDISAKLQQQLASVQAAEHVLQCSQQGSRNHLRQRSRPLQELAGDSEVCGAAPPGTSCCGHRVIMAASCPANEASNTHTWPHHKASTGGGRQTSHMACTGWQSKPTSLLVALSAT